MSNNLEDIALSIYKKNLIYFEKQQPSIYSKLGAFESAVDQNLYKEKYDLILQDNYFDVLEISTGNHLYSIDSNEYAKLAAKSIDNKKNTNAYATFNKITVDDEVLKSHSEMKITDNTLSGFAPVLRHINQYLDDEKELIAIKKFIFFGVGLGTHISSINKKINSSVYLFIEDDLELFRLSLFTTPYYELALKSTLIFSVMETEEEFKLTATKFLKTEFYYNHYIKYFSMLNHSEEKLKNFHIIIGSQSHNLFFYSNILDQFLKPIEHMNNGYNFLNLLDKNISSIFDGKPVLVLAAGPSLAKNIEWLKSHKDNFIIVALSATLTMLEKENISPDIITHIDGFSSSIPHFEKINSLEFLKNTICLFSARTPTEILEKFDKKNIFLFENGTSYKIGLGNLSAACVGSTTYLLLLSFSIKNIYLLGIDMSVDSKTGSTHSSGHEYKNQLDISSSDKHDDTLIYRETVLKAKGNFQDVVYTTAQFMTSVESIDASSIGFKKEFQNVYNLSDGIYLKNTIPKHISDIDENLLKNIDKLEVNKNILNIFTSSSSNEITKNELKLITKRYKHALKMKTIVDNQAKLSFQSADNFTNSLKTIFKNLTKVTDNSGYDLSIVFHEYFQFIYTYIFDFFNTDGIENQEDNIRILNKLLCEQLYKILDIYIDIIYQATKIKED